MSTVSPNRLDQHRAIKDAQNWLCENLDYFKIPVQPNGTLEMSALKRFSEFSVLANILRHDDGSLPFKRFIQSWCDYNKPDADALLNTVKRSPAMLPIALLVLQETEMTTAIAGFYKEYCQNPEWRFFERLPMEDVLIFRIFKHHGFSDSVLEPNFNRLLCNARDEKLNFTIMSVYYICHDIFFISNWGKEKIDIEDRKLNYISNNLKYYFNKFFHEKEYDICFEIVMALFFLGKNIESCIYFDYIDILECNSVMDGRYCLPLHPDRYQNMINNVKDIHYDQFISNYHTVIAFLISYDMTRLRC